MNPEGSNFNPEFFSQKKETHSKSEKETPWEKKMAEVNEIVDSLGKKIDENIKETVVAFSVHGFTTTASCEGHIAEKEEEQHGLSYPWVEICAPEPEGLSDAKKEEKNQLEQEWRIKNLKQQRRMMDFLEEFYEKRKTPFDARLVLEKIGAFGGFRVQSFGAEITEILSPEEKQQKLTLYQKEIRDFTEFLKSKYFSKE